MSATPVRGAAATGFGEHYRTIYLLHACRRIEQGARARCGRRTPYFHTTAIQNRPFSFRNLGAVGIMEWISVHLHGGGSFLCEWGLHTTL